MTKRTFNVDGVSWECVIGRSYVKAKSENNKAKCSTFAEVKNMTEVDYERLKWKRSERAAVTPSDIVAWLRYT